MNKTPTDMTFRVIAFQYARVLRQNKSIADQKITKAWVWDMIKTTFNEQEAAEVVKHLKEALNGYGRLA